MAEEVVSELVGARVALQGLRVGGVQADPESVILAEIEAEQVAEGTRVQPDAQFLPEPENVNRALEVRIHLHCCIMSGPRGSTLGPSMRRW